MSEEQVEIKENTENTKKISYKESKRERRHEKKEEHRERKEEHRENKEKKKKEKRTIKAEKKKEKNQKKIEKIEEKIEKKYPNHHHTETKQKEVKTKDVKVPNKTTTISEEHIHYQNTTNRNVPLNTEWEGIISCDPSEIPDDISLSMSSVNPDQIPDDISISMSEFNVDQSDSVKVHAPRNNLTESDFSPEIQLKDENVIPGSQPNVGNKGVFESKYYQSSSKTEDKY